MNNLLKYSGIALAGLTGLLMILVIILKLIPDNQYKSWIISAAESSTGRSFSIKTLELDFGTSFRISADTVQLANADWAEQADMLTVNRLEAELKLLPLLSGRAEIRTLLDTVDFIAQSNESGVSNWDMSAGLPPDETSEEAIEEATHDDDKPFSLPLRPVIRELRIDNFSFALIDSANTTSKIASLKHLLIETPEQETTLLLDADAGGTPIKLTGSLGNIDAALDQVSTAINISGNFDQNKLNISGEWGPVLPDLNLDLLLDLQVPSTSSVAAIGGYEIGDFGVLDFTARVLATEGVLSIEDMVTKLDGEQTTSSIDGGIADLRLMEGINMGVELDTDALGRLVQHFDIKLPIPLPPEVELSAQVEGGKNGLSINNIIVKVRDEGLEFSLTGAINNVLSSRQIEGQFTAAVDSLSSLSKYANMELPALGAITLSGNLNSEGKAIGLQALNLGLTAENLNLSVTGGIKDLLTVNGIDAQVEADIKSLTEQNISELEILLKPFGVELPTELLPQSLKLRTAVSGNLEQLSLMDIRAEVVDKGINVSLAGAVKNGLVPEGITANISLNSDSVASFSKYAGTELPDLGPLEATAKVVSKDQSYSLESLQANLSAEAIEASLTANIADLLAVRGINAELKANTDTLSSLSGLAKTELPATDPVSLTATLSGEDTDQARLSINAESGNLKIAVDSLFAELKSADDLKIDVSVQAQTLSDFDRFVEKELPDRGPLDLTASINIQPNTYTLSELKLLLGEQSAMGNLTLKLPGPDNKQGITLLHGQLDVPYLNLSRLLPEPVPEDEQTEASTVPEQPVEEEAADTPEETDEPLAPSERLLSDERVLLEKLHDYDIDVAVNGDRIIFGKTELHDLQIKVLLKDGLLNIAPFKGIGVPSGTIDGTIQVDGRDVTPSLTTNIRLENIPLPNLGGALDFSLDIDGKGQSLAELMASLNGQILIVIRDAIIEKSIATNFSTGLLSFSGQDDHTNLECAILRVDIVDGVADFKNKLAAQLTQVTWRGGGYVDFNTERLSADIVPKPRKGIPVSIGGGLAGLVKLGGTLKNPKVQPDYTDAAFKYGKYAAYVSTGGLSLLAEIVANKFQANQDVCATILDGTVFATADKKNNPPR
jgi:uncharacterized protein involved in outer membrane biogenesis